MRAGVLLAVLALAGCTGSPSPDPTPTPGATRLSVGGEYGTQVSLTENTCPGLAVQPNPTTVSQRPGETTMMLTHAGQTYRGTIQTDGRFALAPTAIPLGGGVIHELTITGGFTTTGFSATVAANVTTNGQPSCHYTVAWAGTKNGPPNVLSAG